MRLFGSSGVRGLANVELTTVLAEQVGLAVATFAEAKEVLVARDTRVSGKMLQEALVSGLESGGANVKCLGVMPTPVLAFLTRKMEVDAGVMMTASHNPPEYNGIKIFDREGLAYDEESQVVIERIIAQQRFRLADWKNVGHDQTAENTSQYVDAVEKNVRLRRKWRIVVDAGCGATFSLVPTVLQRLGCTVAALNSQPDGLFPARSPEPNLKSLTDLAAVVRTLHADAGLAYDGDGDRVAFIDENGHFSDFDQVLAAYASHVVKQNRGGTIVTSVEASMAVEKMVERHGGKVVRTKVGDVYITELIKKHNAIFGGEPCGAWIHPQLNYCPDGILSSVMLLKALEDESEGLAEFVAETPKYPILRENFSCKKDEKDEAVEKIGERLKSVFQTYQEFSKVDGVRLVLKTGWLLVRASGTEPLVRLTVEGESLKAAREIMEKGAKSIRNLLGNDDR
ncbi:MAG: phosphoglucosamine mutase [Candidatus Bathyarchaeia archaeon]